MRPPCDAVMHHKQIDALPLCFFERRDAGIDGKSDRRNRTLFPGADLQSVDGCVPDRANIERPVQEGADVFNRRFFNLN